MSVITAYVPLGRALVRPEVSVYVVWSVRLRTDTGTDSGWPSRPRVTTVSWFVAADAAPGSSATDAMSPAAVTPASTRRRRVRSPVITCSPRVRTPRPPARRRRQPSGRRSPSASIPVRSPPSPGLAARSGAARDAPAGLVAEDRLHGDASGPHEPQPDH